MTFGNLSKAVEAAINHGNTLADIRPEWWARTYHCTAHDVEAEFKRQEASK